MLHSLPLPSETGEDAAHYFPNYLVHFILYNMPKCTHGTLWHIVPCSSGHRAMLVGSEYVITVCFTPWMERGQYNGPPGLTAGNCLTTPPNTGVFLESSCSNIEYCILHLSANVVKTIRWWIGCDLKLELVVLCIGLHTSEVTVFSVSLVPYYLDQSSNNIKDLLWACLLSH